MASGFTSINKDNKEASTPREEREDSVSNAFNDAIDFLNKDPLNP